MISKASCGVSDLFPNSSSSNKSWFHCVIVWSSTDFLALLVIPKYVTTDTVLNIAIIAITTTNSTNVNALRSLLFIFINFYFSFYKFFFRLYLIKTIYYGKTLYKNPTDRFFPSLLSICFSFFSSFKLTWNSNLQSSLILFLAFLYK